MEKFAIAARRIVAGVIAACLCAACAPPPLPRMSTVTASIETAAGDGDSAARMRPLGRSPAAGRAQDASGDR